MTIQNYNDHKAKAANHNIMVHCLSFSISYIFFALPHLIYNLDATSAIIPPMISIGNAIYNNPPATIPINITGKNTTIQSSFKIVQDALIPNINSLQTNQIMQTANKIDNMFLLLLPFSYEWLNVFVFVFFSEMKSDVFLTPIL